MNLPEKSGRSQRSEQVRVHPGQTIRTERHRLGMSIRELARRIELTPSHLSKIERGLANPSVGTLWMISDELGIHVASLFAIDAGHEPASQGSRGTAPTPTSVDSETEGLSVFAPAVDPRNRESIKMTGVDFQRLTPYGDATIEFTEVRHDVGAGDGEAYHHSGREFGLLLKGRLLVEVGFAKYVLDPGWSIAFDASNPHRVINVGEGPAVAVWVVVGRKQL